MCVSQMFSDELDLLFTGNVVQCLLVKSAPDSGRGGFSQRSAPGPGQVLKTALERGDPVTTRITPFSK